MPHRHFIAVSQVIAREIACGVWAQLRVPSECGWVRHPERDIAPGTARLLPVMPGDRLVLTESARRHDCGGGTARVALSAERPGTAIEAEKALILEVTLVNRRPPVGDGDEWVLEFQLAEEEPPARLDSRYPIF